MSEEFIKLAFNLIEEYKEEESFIGPITPEVISKAEGVLDLKFPESYKKFLLNYGAGDVLGQEFYGVIPDSLISERVPNAVGLTLSYRRVDKLPNNFVVIGDSGYGPHYVLDCISDSDLHSPIWEWWMSKDAHENLSQKPLANSFGEFLLNQLRNMIE